MDFNELSPELQNSALAELYTVADYDALMELVEVYGVDSVNGVPIEDFIYSVAAASCDGSDLNSGDCTKRYWHNHGGWEFGSGSRCEMW